MKGTGIHFRVRPRHLFFMILLAILCMGAGEKKVSAATAGFQKIDGKTYYIDENGEKHKGWLTLNGKRYFLNKKTGVLKTGWLTTKNGKRYFSAKRGILTVGWKSFGKGKLRYFDTKTGYMKTGWFTDSNGKHYYLDKTTGYAVLGWQKSGSIKRFFNKKTGAMYTGWHKNSKGRRYFDPETGDLYRNKKAVVDGVAYSFNSKGYATKLKSQSEVPEDTSLTITVFDSTNAKYYTIMKEYKTDPGVADGTKSDLDLLAAFCEAEAGNQGKIGMEAVALTLLNRTIDTSGDFPSTVRYVLYQGTTFPQYSVVTNGALRKRLNGNFERKKRAYAAARAALKVFNAYVKNGTKRKIKNFTTKDFNYKYFMTESAFWNQPLNFNKVKYYKYKDHVFFVDWVSS